MDGGFPKYLEEAIGPLDAAVALSALGEPASVSVRLNPLKTLDSGPAFAGCGAVKVPWSPYGRLLDRRPDFTLDPLFHCGAYYVQDSSAMFVGEIFRRAVSMVCGDSALPRRDAASPAAPRCLRVLDLCAAPGGKTTDLASSLREMFGDSFLLVANEVMRDRAGALVENVAKWGDPCVMVTNAPPAAFAALHGFFDVVLADVPCSGEGMFRKDSDARAQWSPENVAMCADRQRGVVADVWPALSCGGLFVYSTCTFNRYENEGVVQWMLDNLDCGLLNAESALCAGLDGCGTADGWRVLRSSMGFRLVPGLVRGEGQFCSALRKTGGDVSDDAGKYMSKNLGFPSQKNNFAAANRGSVRPRALSGLCAGLFDRPVDVGLDPKGVTAVARPQAVSGVVNTVSGAVRTLTSGCTAGTLRAGGLVPSADLALSAMLRRGAFPEAEVDRDTALDYLHGDSIRLTDAPRGYLVLTYRSLPLGFVKNVGDRCNNLLPAARRIRMDVRRSRGDGN